MDKNHHNIDGINFSVIYSGRKTLCISILPDSSVILRVPYLTSERTINRLVIRKADWIKKHVDNFRNNSKNHLFGSYKNGSIQLFKGRKLPLAIIESNKPYIILNDKIELGTKDINDEIAIKKMLYKWYKKNAINYLPSVMDKVMGKYENMMFKPAGLSIRTMRRRWGSCSAKGVITLSTELIKLPEIYIEYVMVHELCHLKHHNHGSGFYNLMSELIPDWKDLRKGLRNYILAEQKPLK